MICDVLGCLVMLREGKEVVGLREVADPFLQFEWYREC